MDFIINAEDVNIKLKQIGKGSEGIAYKNKDVVYKIYYNNMINEGYGTKEKHHIAMTPLETNQIILPKNLIYDKENNYIGYTTKYIEGNQKKKTGITQLPSKKFIKNLKILETDFEIMTQNYIIGADITPFNYVYNQEEETMNIIDPGRYRFYPSQMQDNCRRQNIAQYNNLIELLLYLDFNEYKPVKTKRKVQLLKERIKQEHSNTKYSEFFSEELKDYENVHEYAKSLEKYIK